MLLKKSYYGFSLSQIIQFYRKNIILHRQGKTINVTLYFLNFPVLIVAETKNNQLNLSTF